MYLNPVHREKLSIEEGFQDALNFYLFYSPECPHCQKFLNEQWPTLSRKYKSQIVFNKINCLEDNDKNICKRFNIKSVPALFLVEGDTQLKFHGERSLERITDFLDRNLKERFEEKNNSSEKTTVPTSTPEIIISDTLPAEEPTKAPKPKVTGLVPCNAELTKLEDLDDEVYEYCVKYPKEYKKYNLCLKANLRKHSERNVRPHQLAYTVLAEHIRRCSGNDADTMKKNTYKIKDKIAEWGLCQRELLEQIRNQSTDQVDKDVASAFLYGCGFE